MCNFNFFPKYACLIVLPGARNYHLIKETFNMNNFNFSIPTNIVFGKGRHTEVGGIIASYGVKRVMLVYDGGKFMVESGLLDEVRKSLRDAGLETTELTGIKPNPILSLVHEGIRQAREFGAQFLLAFGGGSTIDTTKAIAAGVPYDGDVWDYFANAIGVHPVFEALPLGVILTISATGSETNAGTIITNEKLKVKYGCGGPALYPKFAILNPEITCTLPPYQTAAGICDMYSHICERYFTNTPDTYAVDAMAEGLFKTIMEIGPMILKDPKNVNLRGEAMWIATVAHNDTVGVGRVQDWATHDLSYEITNINDLTHGAAVTIMLPAWMKYVYKHDLDRFVRYGRNVFGITEGSKEEIALESIARTEKFFSSMGMPVRLNEVGIDESRFDEMSDKVVLNRGTIGAFVPIDKNAAIEIYKLALE